MISSTHKIMWKKWTTKDKTVVDDGYDNDEYKEEYSDEPQGMLMPMIMHSNEPINELLDEDEFKFWLAHTNFTITAPIMDIISNIDGVEGLDIISRYRFRVAVGQLFSDIQVRENIHDELIHYLSHRD